MSLNTIAQIDSMADVVGRCENIRVMLLTNAVVVYGRLYYSEKRRFLDTLNKGMGMKNSPDKRYLLMDEVLLVDHRGDKETIRGTCLIPREMVTFIGTFDETRPSTSESVDSGKMYPWRKKESHGVNVILGDDFSMTGTVYLDQNDKSSFALGSDECFVPATDVVVRSPRLVEDLRFNFLALNPRLMVVLSFQV